MIKYRKHWKRVKGMNSSTRPTGKLFTSNIEGLRRLDVDAELWQITRSGIEIPNAIFVRSLSPSPDLFNTFLTEWKHLPPQVWWPEYEKRFLEELQSQEKFNYLRLIYRKLLHGVNIVLICFCKDYNFCHRRLVGEFFRQYEVQVEELDPITSEQLVFLWR